MKFEFCCSSHPDIVVLMQTARLARYLYPYQCMKEASCSLSHHEQGAPGTVSFTQSLQLLDRTSI